MRQCRVGHLGPTYLGEQGKDDMQGYVVSKGGPMSRYAYAKADSGPLEGSSWQQWRCSAVKGSQATSEVVQRVHFRWQAISSNTRDRQKRCHGVGTRCVTKTVGTCSKQGLAPNIKPAAGLCRLAKRRQGVSKTRRRPCCSRRVGAPAFSEMRATGGGTSQCSLPRGPCPNASHGTHLCWQLWMPLQSRQNSEKQARIELLFLERMGMLLQAANT